MADDTKPDMTEGRPRVHPDKTPRVHPDDSRRVYGARGVGALIPAIARPAFRRRSPAAAQILADWASIVGPALAATTVPRRLSAGRLAIACSGPVAMELQHLAPQLIARINAHVGQALVTELRFTQDLMPAAVTAVPPPRQASAQAVAAVAKKVSTLPDGPLRDALEALGRTVHAARGPAARKHSTPHPPRD